MYAENAPAALRNWTFLNNLHDGVYSIGHDDKIPNGCRYSFSVTQAAQNQKQTNTGGIAKLFQLKIGAKVKC